MQVLFAKKNMKSAFVIGLLIVAVLVVWAVLNSNRTVHIYDSLAGLHPGLATNEQQLTDQFGTPTSVAPGKAGQTRYVYDRPPRFLSVVVGDDGRIDEVFVDFPDATTAQTYQTELGIGAQSTLDDLLRVYGDRCSRRFERSFMGSGDATILRYWNKEIHTMFEFTFRQIDPFSQSKEQRLMDIRFYRE